MITYSEIKKAVNRQLKKTGIDVNSNDVEEGFDRPSFFVQLINPIRSGDENQVHRSMTVQIYYFPTDRYESSIEVLDMQETLEDLFDLKLAVNDRLLNVDEFNSFINDGILNASFDLEFYNGRRTEYGNIIIEVDDDGNPVDEGGSPVEIPLDGEIPIVDGDGKPIPIEKMAVLELEKE